MAKNGAFFAAAARVDPRWHTPVIAIVAQGVCTMLMTFTPFLNLMFYVGFLLNFSAVMSVVSLMVFRRRKEWKHLPVVNFLYPVIPVLFIVVGIVITIFGMTLEPKISLVAMLTVAAGALVYHFRLRTRRA